MCAKHLMLALIASGVWSGALLSAAGDTTGKTTTSQSPQSTDLDTTSSSMDMSSTGSDLSSTDEQAKKKKPTIEEILAPEYLKQLSQTYGHMIQTSLNNPYIKIDMNDVVKGMQDAQAGKPAPLADKDYEYAMRMLQGYAREEAVKVSRKEAETFLKQNATQEGVVELEPGKLQYKITQPGSGEQVTEETLPKVNFSATLLDGSSIGSSDHQNGGPVDLVLKNTIPGLRRGVLGMKVGEKRRIFLHPDMAFGNSGPTNGLVIFDVEVVSVGPKPADDAESDEEGDENDDVSFDDIVEDTDDDDDYTGDDSDDDDSIDFDEDEDEDLSSDDESDDED